MRVNRSARWKTFLHSAANQVEFQDMLEENKAEGEVDFTLDAEGCYANRDTEALYLGWCLRAARFWVVKE